MSKINKIKSSLHLPLMGMGTFGSDKYDDETVANAVYTAICEGYRIFDCASVYGNEKQIGEVFKKAFDNGICKREDLFITSKVWNDMHGDGEVIASCKKTLSDLQLDYIDLFFVHWPFPNYHAKGCTVDSRNPDSKPFFADEFIKVWEQMEYLKENGYVKRIGMSNMTIPKFEAVLPKLKTMPFAHEMEMHPSFQQKELFDYCVEKEILPIGYCPLGSPNRPERDKTPDDVADTQLPEVLAIAAKYNCHPAEICLRWAITNGQIPIPFASQKTNIANNLKICSMSPLTADDMAVLARADKNCRLVKGHVFLWNGAKDWTDLWDMDGKISDWYQTDGVWSK